jgi:hypothetical protein
VSGILYINLSKYSLSGISEIISRFSYQMSTFKMNMIWIESVTLQKWVSFHSLPQHVACFSLNWQRPATSSRYCEDSVCWWLSQVKWNTIWVLNMHVFYELCFWTLSIIWCLKNKIEKMKNIIDKGLKPK